MLYQAIARKYRPEVFAQVVGQEHVTATLRAALRHDKLSHAYLFSGPRGCGKTTVARLLAKALNCPNLADGEPCGECSICRGIAAGSFLDVLEIDAASHTGVDNVRELREMARLSPSEGRSRVFIIDEVHMLSRGAFNALLKILEEPPPKVFFFFATTEPSKIPRTILSRCQRFDFRLLARHQLTERIHEICTAEGVGIDEGGLRLLASLAEGSLRDGLSLLDQAIAASDGTIDEELLIGLFGLIRIEFYDELNEAILALDPARALRLVDRLAIEGHDLVVFARGLITHFRNLLVLKIEPALRGSVDLTAEQIERLQPMLDHFAEQDLLAMLDRAGIHFDRIHRSTQPRILLEAALVEFCRWEKRILLVDLVQRLRRLQIGTTTPASTPASTPDGKGTASGAGRHGSAGEASPDNPARPRLGSTKRGSHSEPAADPPVPATVFAAAGTVDGWTELVQGVNQRNPGLAACLLDGLPAVQSEAGTLTVAYAPENAFMMRQVHAGRLELEQRIAICFGRPLKLELVMVEPGGGPTSEEREEMRYKVAPTDRELLERQCAGDPDLRRLVELVQGVPLAESERESWQRSTPAPAAPGSTQEYDECSDKAQPD